MRQSCPCCSRPYDDEWVVYCPVTRTLAEDLKGDGLTTSVPVNIRLDREMVMIVTELYNDSSRKDGRES